MTKGEGIKFQLRDKKLLSLFMPINNMQHTCHLFSISFYRRTKQVQKEEDEEMRREIMNKKIELCVLCSIQGANERIFLKNDLSLLASAFKHKFM